jgi:hypothetical protein
MLLLASFMRRGVVICTVINGFVFDGATKDPMQQAVRDALIAFMAATALFVGLKGALQACRKSQINTSDDGAILQLENLRHFAH